MRKKNVNTWLDRLKLYFYTSIATMIGLLLVSLGCQRASTPVAPQVNGKTLQEWADVAAAPLKPDPLTDPHQRELLAREKRTRALDNIRAFDAAAIPVLMELTQQGDRQLSVEANRILSQMGNRISPEAETVIPLLAALREKSNDTETKRWTDSVLKDISAGTTPVSAMMNPLSSRDLRSVVVVELAKSDWWINGMGFSKKPLDVLRDIAFPSTPKASPDSAYTDVTNLYEQVSGARMYVIDNFETKRLPPAAELIEQAKNPRTMMLALQGLQHYAQAGAAVPGVDLGSLTPDLSGAIPALIQIVESGHRGNATRAIKILGLIGPAASSAVPLALDLLESDFYDARAEAAAALGGFGVGDRKIIQALVDSAENEQTESDRHVRPHRPGTGQGLGMRSQLAEGTLRANVAVSLGKLRSHPDLSIPALVKMLDLTYAGSSERCDLAAAALAEFGHDAQLAIPQLVEMLQSKPLRQPALTTLRRIDPGLAKTIPMLITNLASDNDGIRLHAILVLALLRTESEPAITSLETIAESGDETISAWAAYALWKIAPDTHSLKPAIPVLITTLEDPKTRYLNKFGVLIDLASLGPDAKPAVPAITTAIQRGDFGKSGHSYLKMIDPEASVLPID